MGIGEHKDIDSAGLPRGREESREGDNVYVTVNSWVAGEIIHGCNFRDASRNEKTI